MQDAQTLGTWVLCLGVLLGIAVNVVALINSRHMQKREVSFSETYATTDQLTTVERDLSVRIDAVDADVNDLRESIIKNGEERRVRIEGKVEAFRTEAWEQMQRLDDKINCVSREVSKLQQSAETTNQQIVLIDGKIDRLVSRIT